MKLTDMIKMGMKGFKPSDIKQINESGISTEEVIKWKNTVSQKLMS